MQNNEPIAIVGIGCRFPGGANSASKLWELLKDPPDLRTEIPKDRFNADAFHHPDNLHHGTSNVRHSYLLAEDHRKFDASFFGINPAEAASIDPQQRLLLETVYESLEAAGTPMEQLKGSSTAVFVGLMCADYADIVGYDVDNIPKYYATGTARSLISNRISYFFDWHGPSMTIDTACSSSLVAVHQAVQVLRSRESRVAIAAGANLLLGPAPYIAESKLQMLSPDGRCYMWDDRANGYARGEGIASIVLKTLSAALEDKDDIQCIIRETGINQDGRTKGITMPSAAAQAALIEATYRKAGLNLAKVRDKPQFFEAHGTGTPAGDPQEAEAIHRALTQGECRSPVYVGSVKTVIGHTEGTAGLAGLLKAALALQHGIIPPNRWFDRLNPAIEPFYGDLQIATSSVPWPLIKSGAPRRASVNSFGFGGSNAHCVLESHPGAAETQSSPRSLGKLSESRCFIFSAASERPLVAMVKNISMFLTQNKAVDLASLWYTLTSRRSCLAQRIAFTATTADDLCDKLENFITTYKMDNTGSPIVIAPKTSEPWPGMGSALMAFPTVRNIFKELDESLMSLPEADRPKWSLAKEIMADSSSSRVNEAAFSQPLCTAAAGIQFRSVVGHSSGEIAAAYAAGYISAQDAIRVAYYRGLHLHLAGGNNGQSGAMVAFCKLRRCRGKICVAARDADVVSTAQTVFQDEKKFARLLKVDTAYHSHHMQPCSRPYLDSLRSCQIKVLQHVHTQDVSAIQAPLVDQYWALNLTLQNARPDLAIEIGPHPSLKGPASKVIRDSINEEIPYTGVLKRKCDDTDAVSAALGYTWSVIGSKHVNFTEYDNFISGGQRSTRIHGGLPSYPWDHDRVHWHESRVTKAFHQRSSQSCPLVGVKSPNSSSEQMQWTNHLIPREIAWIAGHRIQGQMVFPAAGYISAAVEVSRCIAGDAAVQIIEVSDFEVGQAMVFDTESSSIETLVSVTGVKRNDSYLTAHFTFLSAPDSEMMENASCKLHVTFGEPDLHALPSTDEQLYGLNPVDSEYFYNTFASYGYGYSGPFRTLSSLKRKLGLGTGCIHAPDSNTTEGLAIHPATLDTAIQAILLAHSYPGDGQIAAIQLPTSISRIVINPSLCLANSAGGATMKIISTITSNNGANVNGDVDIYPSDSKHSMLQLECLRTKPMVPPTASTDVQIFSQPVWESAYPDALSLADSSVTETRLGYILERVAYFYLRQIQKKVRVSDRQKCEPHFIHLLSYVDSVLSRADSNSHPLVQADWATDTEDDIIRTIERHPESIDLRLMRAVGENVVDAIQGKTTLLEHMLQENILNKFYTDGHGMAAYLEQMSNAARQIGHRYPTMNVLEVGAGTGGATRFILEKLGTAFASYTYTDISSGFFDQARELFAISETKMVFKVLDIEKDIAEQGFPQHSYDLVIASLVLHATARLEETLCNVRQLLKPGGYLLMLEITDNDPLRFGFIFGGLPGWWRGVDDGRTLSPCIELLEWEALLEDNGFSGVDYVKSEDPQGLYPFCALVSQAVDDPVSLLRNPLQAASQEVSLGHITIIGETSANTQDCAKSLCSSLDRFATTVTRIPSLPALVGAELPLGGNSILLQEFDAPVFQELSREVLQGLQAMIERSKNVIWVTRGQRECAPSARMSLGYIRCIVKEMRHVRVQCLDFSLADDLDADRVAEAMLQLAVASKWEEMGSLGDLLWSVEAEIAYDGPRQLIPRARLNKTLNDRYNSSRRSISFNACLDSETVELTYQDGIPVLNHIQPLVSLPVTGVRQEEVVLRTLFSSLSAVRVGSHGYLYLVVGETVPSGERVLAFSTTLCSRLNINRSYVCPCPQLEQEPGKQLAVVLSHLLAQATLSQMAAGSRLLVVDPSQTLAHALVTAASAQGIEVAILSSDRATYPSEVSVTEIHTHVTKRQLWPLLPGRVSRLLTCSPASWIPWVKECLSGITSVESLETLTSACATMNGLKARDHVAGLLQECVLERRNDIGPESVIDWGTSSNVPALLQPADSRPLFRSDRTYWLVGLTGALGLSLCQWMVRCGAKYIAISSRRPQVDPEWVSDLAKKGASINIYSSDVTNRESVQSIYEEIRSSLPEIAGVCQGAMVLHDTLFQNLDMERTQKVLQPKVRGAQLLDELFHETPLDWFVFLSSMACITGSPGQSAYAAANQFLVGLAAERRRRGVAASTVHIGAILGTGYIARELNLAQQILLRKGGNNWMSERDFHQIFAEAVVASPPGPQTSPEYYTGLRQSLGIDSLIAVDLRSWFLKELGVDIPVLKIISGATIGQLLQQAQGSLSPELTPRAQIEGNTDISQPLPEPDSVHPMANAESSVPLTATPEQDSYEWIDDDRVSPRMSDDDKDPISVLVQSIPTIASESENSSSSSKSMSESFESSMASGSPVSRAYVERRLPMSFAQSRFWFLTFLLDDKACFNVTTSIRLQGKLEVDRLAAAVEVLGKRHESLRTRLYLDDKSGPMQHVVAQSLLRLEYKRISTPKEASKEFQLLKQHVYDLEKGETLRIMLLSLSEECQYILLGYHHINMDGISFEIFFKDLECEYNSPSSLPSAAVQYADFSVNQRKAYADGLWEQALAYWRRELIPNPTTFPLLPMSSLPTRPTLTQYRSYVASHRLDSTISARVGVTCAKLKVHTFQFYLAVYRFCIGVADAGRQGKPAFEGLGCYLNLLPIAFVTPATDTFRQIVKDTKAKSQNAFANAQVPIDVLLNELQVPRSSSASPLFQVFFNYRQGWVEFDGGQTAYDISLDVVDNPGGDPLLRVFLQGGLYSQDDADLLITAFQNLVQAFAQSPTLRITRPPLFTPENIKSTVSLARGQYQSTKMATLHSNRVALKDGHGGQLTYSQLHTRCHCIARHLVDHGVRSGCRVGVFQDRSIDWVCSMLAIFYVGGVYLPLDPAIASKRLPAILEDCQPTLILTDNMHDSELKRLSARSSILNITTIRVVAGHFALRNLSSIDSPMTILYTSGSTGAPKGIEISHASVKTHIETFTDKWLRSIKPLNVLQQSSFSFDMSLDQILWPLCSGGCVYIVPQSDRGDPTAITRLLGTENITVTAATPSQYLTWIHSGLASSLRDSPWTLGICGGEAFTGNLARAFAELSKSDLTIIDCYGPTETTCFSHYCELSLNQLQTWGGHPGFSPRSNIATYILDDELSCQPVNMPGQIAIGGMGLTRDRFVRDQLAPKAFVDEGWTTMHLTGDRGRLRIHGDTQIKLRGLRCDLRDIEASVTTASQGQIIACIVSVRKSGTTDEDMLVAHVEFTTGQGNSSAGQALNDIIRSLPLPQYMHPSILVPVDELPRTSSGKIDRLAVNKLPLPHQQNGNKENMNQKMNHVSNSVWMKVLPADIAANSSIDPQSDFFHPLLRETFGLQIPVVQLFDASTLAKMTRLIDQQLGHDELSLSPDIPRGTETRHTPSSDESIDWEIELAGPSRLSVSTAIGATAPRVVVLTGATGFLGRAILRQLVSQPCIERIHCIAWRVKAQCTHSLFSHSKIQLHRGDLSLPDLGLTPEMKDSIFKKADTIIHNGADVSFLKSYSSLRQVNVESTKQLSSWAVQHGLRFHYISTGSVAYLTGREQYPAMSVKAFHPPTDGTNAYIATKWASEVYLERMHQKFGLPVVFHRPSSLTGVGAPSTDMMTAVLRYSKIMFAVPRTELIRGYFDFISVDRAATEIVQGVVAGNDAEGIHYQYQSGEVQIHSDRIQQALEQQTGETFTALDMEEWVMRAELLGMDSMVGHLLKGSKNQGLMMTRLMKE
ncbi:putative hybrid NRPS/PKS enzyme [Aspergillus venezuelensis]